MRLYFGPRFVVHGGVFTMLFAACLWLLWLALVWLPVMLARLAVIGVLVGRAAWRRPRVAA